MIMYLQCFDTVGWVTGRALQLVNISRQQSPEILVWEFFGGPGLTGSDLQKNRRVKPKVKVV